MVLCYIVLRHQILWQEKGRRQQLPTKVSDNIFSGGELEEKNSETETFFQKFVSLVLHKKYYSH